MKSTTVYKMFDAHISSDLKSNKYKKVSNSMLGYSKKVGERYINFWVQCSRDGFDQYAGSKFIVQFSINLEAEIGYSGSAGGRIPKYFTMDELEQARQKQNNIISRLTKPSQNYFSSVWKTEMINWYLNKFEPVIEPFTNTSDIWFRYKDELDINEWGIYLNKIILRTLALLEAEINVTEYKN